MADSVTVPPSELAERTQATENSVRRYVANLEFLVRDNQSGGYRIRDHKIGEATKFLEKAK